MNFKLRSVKYTDTQIQGLCAMMAVVHVAVAVLCLLSLGRSAPVRSCESLTQPLAISGKDQLLGKWMHLAESSNMTASQLLTKMYVETSWCKITADNESDVIYNYQAQKVFGECFSLTTKLTLKNGTLSGVHPLTASTILLNTSCTDCIVFYWKATTGTNRFSGLQLLSKRSKVSAAEMQEFMKQAECLNLPSPVVLDPEKGFCPDESPSQDKQPVDLTSVMNEMDMDEVFNLFHKITSSEGGLKMLMEMFSSEITASKQD